MVLSRGCLVIPFARSSWSRLFEEFNCRGCGAGEAFRSRPRGLFEKFVLPLLLLQTVRCDRCYHRSYILRTVPALERAPLTRKESQSESVAEPKTDNRVA
jgi:hypothetical protein